MKTVAARKKKVLIVDDHPLLREGLGRVINQQSDLSVCCEASDGPGGLAAVQKFRPDIVIADISLENGDGLDLIKSIHAHYPGMPVLALSMHHENMFAERALRAGASGYVMKREPVANVMTALRKILKGQKAISDNIINQLVGLRDRKRKTVGDSPVDILSNRELEVYRCLGHGLSTRDIAHKLNVAVSTVETYRSNIKKKMHFETAIELVSHAARYLAEQNPR